jgi:hypothetical protein
MTPECGYNRVHHHDGGETIVRGPKWREQSLFAVRTVRNTQIHCGQFVPHRRHHVSATEPNRLMLCGETVAVYCENRTEHIDTLWAVRTSQETHHVSATEPNRLMLCGKTVAVCCENRTEHTNTLCGQSVPHRRHITFPLQSPTG